MCVCVCAQARDFREERFNDLKSNANIYVQLKDQIRRIYYEEVFPPFKYGK